jgi:hypothetical protein
MNARARPSRPSAGQAGNCAEMVANRCWQDETGRSRHFHAASAKKAIANLYDYTHNYLLSDFQGHDRTREDGDGA